MKLSKKEAQKAINNYGLGLVKSVKYIESGWDNFSYDIETDKGEYILQNIAGEFTKEKERNMKLQFKILEFLRRSGFKYEIPTPIKNKKGKEITAINEKRFWVYRKIPGNANEKLADQKIRELAKALALYALAAKKFPKGEKSFFNYNWIKGKYESMKKIHPKNRIDRLMLKNIGFFIDLVKHLEKIDYGDNFIFTHADINMDNVVFRNNKVIGIIDFNNVEYAPLANDIAITIFETSIKKYNIDKKRYNLILKEYEKIKHLTDKDKELIIPLILRYYCMLFWDHYEGMKKHREIRYRELKNDIRAARNIVKDWKQRR